MEHEKKELAEEAAACAAQLQPVQQQQPQQHSLLSTSGPAQAVSLPHEGSFSQFGWPSTAAFLGLGGSRQPGLAQPLMPTQPPAHALQQRLAPSMAMVSNQGHMLWAAWGTGRLGAPAEPTASAGTEAHGYHATVHVHETTAAGNAAAVG